MPNHWLVKTEPGTYSFADLEREGRAVWDGVTNPVALKHLRAMRTGDQVFVYHTGNEKSIVGIAEVVAAAYPDPKQEDARLVVVELRARSRLKRPVALSEVKAHKELANWELARIARLSVMPATAQQWATVVAASRAAVPNE